MRWGRYEVECDRAISETSGASRYPPPAGLPCWMLVMAIVRRKGVDLEGRRGRGRRGRSEEEEEEEGGRVVGRREGRLPQVRREEESR